jgi:hypothetical protein
MNVKEEQEHQDEDFQNAFFTGTEHNTDPQTAKEALARSDGDLWEVMHKSQVPKGKKVLGRRLILRTKRDRDGKILRRKARWVVKGYEQRYGKEYEQTFAGVCKSATWKIAVALAARFDLEIEQMDVDTAFLENDIDAEVYVELPPGWCENGVKLSKEDVCKLSRALYGLKQSPHLWQKKLCKALQSLGFEPLETDQCIYINKDTKIIIVTYVDDCLIIGKDNEDLSKLKYELQTKFTIEELGLRSIFLEFASIETERRERSTLDRMHTLKRYSSVLE